MKTKNEVLADLAGCDVSVIEGWKEMGGYVPIGKVLEAMDVYGDVFPNFWERLRMFVANVEVHDCASEEEKEMILFVCKERMK